MFGLSDIQSMLILRHLYLIPAFARHLRLTLFIYLTWVLCMYVLYIKFVGDALASYLVSLSLHWAVRVVVLSVVNLGKTLNSHSASLHPGIWMGTGKLNAWGSPVMD